MLHLDDEVTLRGLEHHLAVRDDHPAPLETRGARVTALTVGEDEVPIEPVLVLVGVVRGRLEVRPAAPRPGETRVLVPLPDALRLLVDGSVEVEDRELRVLRERHQVSEEELQRLIVHGARLVDVDRDRRRVVPVGARLDRRILPIEPLHVGGAVRAAGHTAELLEDRLPVDLSAEEVSKLLTGLRGDRAPLARGVTVLDRALQRLLHLALDELPLLVVHLIPSLVVVHPTGDDAHRVTVRVHQVAVLVDADVAVLERLGEGLPLGSLLDVLSHVLEEREVLLGGEALRQRRDLLADSLVAGDSSLTNLRRDLGLQRLERLARNETTLGELLLRNHRVDGEVRRVVVERVGLHAPGGGVLENEVEALVLEEALHLLGGESRHEVGVPPHVDVAVLGEHARRGDFLRANLRDGAEHLREEGLIPHEVDEVGIDVEGVSLRLGDLLGGLGEIVRGGSVLCHMCSLYPMWGHIARTDKLFLDLPRPTGLCCLLARIAVLLGDNSGPVDVGEHSFRGLSIVLVGVHGNPKLPREDETPPPRLVLLSDRSDAVALALGRSPIEAPL